MALRRTTLSAAISANALTFGVTSTASDAYPAVGSAPLVYQPLIIDDEVMFLVSVPVANIVTVRGRGSDGTIAVAHDVFSTVVTSANAQDFPLPPATMGTLLSPWAPDVRTYGQDGAILVPSDPLTTVYLAKGSAGAYTLGAPSLAQNGIELKVTSQTAFAHVVTATALLDTGGAGSPYTTATFPAQPGASMSLVAQNGLWNVLNSSVSPVVFT